MHLVGSAALWLQTLQCSVDSLSWDTFAQNACNRFDRDEHNQLLRQFFHTKQHSTVSEYIEGFSDLIHQLLAHEPSFNASVITTRFIDWLRKEF